MRQGMLTLYATSLTVRDLRRPDFYSINKLDPDGTSQGYQRLLNEGRARRLADYLIDGLAEKDAFLPTSIFLATSHDIPFDATNNTITIDTAVTGPFSVVDGQHRIAGLILAGDRDPAYLDFEVPVNIAIKLDDISQTCHFLIVNTTQRSVDKAIEQQIVARLTRMVSLEKTPTIPRWIRRQVEKGEDMRALAVARYLNDQKDSPWRGRIRMANSDEAGSINQRSFISSLKKYVFSANNPLSNPVWDEKRPMILLNYWKAITDLLVDRDEETPTTIFKTSGVDLFHIVSATVFTQAASQQNFTVEAMRETLRRGLSNLPDDTIALSHPDWWLRGGQASGLNSAGVRKLASSLSHALNVRDNVSTIAI